jgi:hypothetical protein
MRRPEFMRSNTFRWAFMMSGVFALFIIVLFGFIYWKLDDYLIARSDRVITAQMSGIADLSPERRMQAVAERLRQDPRGVQLAADCRQFGKPAARSANGWRGAAHPYRQDRSERRGTPDCSCDRTANAERRHVGPWTQCRRGQGDR